MPIKSYIAFPKPGQKEALIESLLQLPGCEVSPAHNEEIVIVVTDSTDERKDEELYGAICSLSSLRHISFVSGFAVNP